MILIKLKTKKDYIYINPESIAYIKKKSNKEDITLIVFNSGNAAYANIIEIYEPIKTVLRKFEFEE